MDRNKLKAIFADTRNQYLTVPKLKNAVLKSSQKQRIYDEGSLEFIPDQIHDSKTRIIISDKRSLEAALAYKGKRVTVLNFANAYHPGGGVRSGASAQEECICRCSTLYENLVDESVSRFYDSHHLHFKWQGFDDCIYTPDVCVFKSDALYPKLLDERDWYNVNVITCAAPNLNECFGEVDRNELKTLFEKRFRQIFKVAQENNNEVLIVGAFGCGAFKNDPNLVASALAKVIEENPNVFEVIEAAVYDRNPNQPNYSSFAAILDPISHKRS